MRPNSPYLTYALGSAVVACVWAAPLPGRATSGEQLLEAVPRFPVPSVVIVDPQRAERIPPQLEGRSYDIPSSEALDAGSSVTADDAEERVPFDISPNTWPILVRDDPPPDPASGTNNQSAAVCQTAVDLLREDFAGHGIPLTNIVLESSTFLLLAGFVLYFLLLRRRYSYSNRGHLRMFLSQKSPTDAESRDSTCKHPTPTITTPRLLPISEDPLPSTPTHSFYSQVPPSPHPLSPLRGIPGSPGRSPGRSLTLNLESRASSLEKKPSFLSLKD